MQKILFKIFFIVIIYKMLDPKKDRFDYKEILKAPPNYYFDFAITTTYSLDLEALM